MYMNAQKYITNTIPEGSTIYDESSKPLDYIGELFKHPPTLSPTPTHK
jgi:hypothetical protein